MRTFSPILTVLAMVFAVTESTSVRAEESPCGECKCSRCTQDASGAHCQIKSTEMVYHCECHNVAALSKHKKSTSQRHSAQYRQNANQKLTGQQARSPQKPIAKEKTKAAITYRWVEKDVRTRSHRSSRPGLPADNLSVASCARVTDETTSKVAMVSHEESESTCDEPQAFATDEPLHDR